MKLPRVSDERTRAVRAQVNAPAESAEAEEEHEDVRSSHPARAAAR